MKLPFWLRMMLQLRFASVTGLPVEGLRRRIGGKILPVIVPKLCPMLW